jgi:hypothetical protein
MASHSNTGKAGLIFLLKTNRTDKKFLIKLIEDFKEEKYNPIEFLHELLPVVFYMRDPAKVPIFRGRAAKNVNMVLDYLLFANNKFAPSWTGKNHVNSTTGETVRLMGIVDFFQDKKFARSRSSITASVISLIRDTIMYIRQNQDLCEGLLKK